MVIIKKIAQKLGMFLLWLVYGLLTLVCFLSPLVNASHGILKVLTNVGMVSFGLSILSILLGSVVVAPRFDIKYKEEILSDKNIDTEIFNLVMSQRLLVKLAVPRFAIYAHTIVFPSFAFKKPGYKKWFKGDSLRAQARRIDKFFAFTYFYTMVTALSFILIASVISYFQ